MGLKPIKLDVALFMGPSDLERSRLTLSALLYGLSLANKIFLEYYPKTPKLYDTSVIYRAETETEHWSDIPTTLKRGYGDCEDLACWRCGELQNQGINALPFIKWRKQDGRTIYHVIVRWPDGRLEDPSRSLGMYHPITRKPVFVQ